jgi:O-acetylserine/cysteine efflux transporter
MPLRDQLYAALVALIWGLAFIVVKYGVEELPPLMLTAMRFLFTAIPAIFFIPAPKTSPWIVIAYGLVLGVGQFGFVFTAMAMGLSVGLTAIVVQTQVFFTIILTVIVFRERPMAHQIAGAVIAFAGVALIGQAKAGDVVFVPFLMVIAGAFCWGSANVIGKAAGRIDMLSFVVWSSLVSPIPLVILSLLLEGRAGVDALMPPSWTIVVVILLLAWPSTLFCFGMWSHLLSRYPAASVAPFALLVPLVGLVAGAVFLDERIGIIELAGGSLVMAGLACVLFWPRLKRAVRF